MNRTLSQIFLAALSAAALAAALAAQGTRPIADWGNLSSQLIPGSEIRITTATEETLHGFVQRVTPDSLAISATTSQETRSPGRTSAASN